MNLRYFRTENARMFRGVRRIYNYLDYCIAHVVCQCKQKEYFYFRFYEKNIFEQNSFVTNRRFKRMTRTMFDRSQRYTLDNKVAFLKKYKDYIHREWIFMDECSYESFCAFVDRHNEFFVKPVDLNQGQGIHKCMMGGNAESTAEAFERLRAGHYLLEEPIIQHEVLSRLNPSSVNTVRMMTILAAGEAHVFAATLRIGNGGVVDNLHAGSGGLCAAVDVGTGIVMSNGMSLSHDLLTHHPGTGVQVIGVQLPHWSGAVDLVKAAAEQLPGMSLVGWDVAITPTGCCLIEGNSSPSFEFPQAVENKGKYAVIRELLGA